MACSIQIVEINTIVYMIYVYVCICMYIFGIWHIELQNRLMFLDLSVFMADL